VTRHLFAPDPIGSTVALLNTSRAKTDTFMYWPYGEVKSRTGSTPTQFRFMDSKQFYNESASLTYGSWYNQRLGVWMTVQLFGMTYSFFNQNPTSGNRQYQREEPTLRDHGYAMLGRRKHKVCGMTVEVWF
jgi:hypothetical protein